MRRRAVLAALILASCGLLAGCVEVRDPTLDEMDPGRHARDYTQPPGWQTLSPFGDPYVPPPDPWP